MAKRLKSRNPLAREIFDPLWHQRIKQGKSRKSERRQSKQQLRQEVTNADLGNEPEADASEESDTGSESF